MVDALLRMFDYWRAHPTFQLKYSIIIGSRQIHFARNALVRAGLNQGADYIAFLDADMTFPPDVIHRLYSASKDIIGVLYKGRLKPHPYNIFYWNESKTQVEQVKKNWKVPQAPLIEVDGVGTGVMLIRRKVFNNLSMPWFFYGDNRSEDILFCETARKAGIKIFVDTSLKCGHIGDCVYE